MTKNQVLADFKPTPYSFCGYTFLTTKDQERTEARRLALFAKAAAKAAAKAQRS
jgi:hypothetical protein